MRFVAFWLEAAMVCRIRPRSFSKLMGLKDCLEREEVSSLDLDFL